MRLPTVLALYLFLLPTPALIAGGVDRSPVAKKTTPGSARAPLFVTLRGPSWMNSVRAEPAAAPAFALGSPTRPDFFATGLLFGQEPRAVAVEAIEIPAAKPAPMPGYEASTQLGVILFVAGVAGWVALAIATFVLERRRPPETPAHDSHSS
jgi:hypothetical protein